MKRLLLKGLFFSLVIATVSLLWKRYRVAPSLDVFEMNLYAIESGDPINWKQYEHQPKIITFWAPWCRDCLEEMPALDAACESLSEYDVACIAISDYDLEKLIGFKSAHAYHFDYYNMHESLKEWNIYSIPTTYVLSSSNTLIYKKVGEIDWANTQFLEDIAVKISES